MNQLWNDWSLRRVTKHILDIPYNKTHLAYRAVICFLLWLAISQIQTNVYES